MPTTSNFGWTTPADTDLVKDGAAAIRTLANGIDSSLIDLKGGTTGQILSKASNTDLDYSWINNDQGDITAVTAGTGITGGGTTGAVTITNDMATTITASGDIVVGTGNGTYDNLPIGTTGQVLTADTSVSPYKVKWASVSSTPAFVGVSAFKTAAQSLANNTGVLVSFNDEDFDTDGFHSTTTNTTRFTIPSGKAGKYLLVARANFDANATGVRSIYWKKNGNTIAQPAQWSAGSAGQTRMCITTILSLAEGDYIELEAYQNSGGALDLVGTTEFTNMQMQFLGA